MNLFQNDRTCTIEKLLGSIGETQIPSKNHGEQKSITVKIHVQIIQRFFHVYSQRKTTQHQVNPDSPARLQLPTRSEDHTSNLPRAGRGTWKMLKESQRLERCWKIIFEDDC